MIGRLLCLIGRHTRCVGFSAFQGVVEARRTYCCRCRKPLKAKSD
jgi:hypothetical protein